MRDIQHGHDRKMEKLTSDHGAGEEAIIRACDGDDLSIPTGETAAHALGEFLRRIVVPGQVVQTSRRFAVFASIFAPEILGLSFRTMAKDLGCTRACLSKHGIQLRKVFHLTSRGAKPARAVNNYRLAQLRAVAEGRHASQRIRARNVTHAA